MNTTHPSHPPARLGANHGYSIDGDVATIHADVEVLNHALLTGDWALQLWACDSPHSGGALSGVIVAEAAVGAGADDAETHRRFVAETGARVPGGLRDYAMVLVLASGRDGHHGQVHDFANYPARQRFITPHLEGSVGYEIDGDQVLLKADAVRSPRDVDNLSGSLRLELRAMQTPHAGNSEGQLLGRLELGRLRGQDVLTNIAERVAYRPASAGRWDVVLMLREWAGTAGWVTRDYASFAIPYEVDEPVATEAATPTTEADDRLATPAQDPASSATNSAPVAPVATESAALIEAPPVSGATASVRATAAAAGAGATATPFRAGVSVNHASLVELAAVKGLSRAVAREIVKGRPYESLAALLDVRGIGPKLLLRLREHLSL